MKCICLSHSPEFLVGTTAKTKWYLLRCYFTRILIFVRKKRVFFTACVSSTWSILNYLHSLSVSSASVQDTICWCSLKLSAFLIWVAALLGIAEVAASFERMLLCWNGKTWLNTGRSAWEGSFELKNLDILCE